MTAAQFRAALDHLGLTQVGAAAMLGISDRAVRRYVAGVTIPEPTAKLLRLAVAGKLSAKDIAKA